MNFGDLLLLFFTSGSQSSGKSSVGRKRTVKCSRETGTGPVLRRQNPRWFIEGGRFSVFSWGPDISFLAGGKLSMETALSAGQNRYDFGRVNSPLLAEKHPS